MAARGPRTKGFRKKGALKNISAGGLSHRPEDLNSVETAFWAQCEKAHRAGHLLAAVDAWEACMHSGKPPPPWLASMIGSLLLQRSGKDAASRAVRERIHFRRYRAVQRHLDEGQTREDAKSAAAKESAGTSWSGSASGMHNSHRKIVKLWKRARRFWDVDSVAVWTRLDVEDHARLARLIWSEAEPVGGGCYVQVGRPAKARK
jgi:hypothetical protein